MAQITFPVAILAVIGSVTSMVPTLQQNGAPMHCERTVLQWLNQHFNLRVISWEAAIW